MSEDMYKRIFSKNLKHYMEVTGKAQTDLIRDLGFNKSAVSSWCNGTRLPRMDKIEMLAQYFGIQRSDLIEEPSEDDGYYLDPDTAAAAQKMFENPSLRILFDAECDMSPEPMDAVYNMISALKKDSTDTDDTGY